MQSVLLLLSWLIVFSAVSIKASAEVEITKVSAFTGRSFFGDVIHGTGYLDNTPYTLTFNYVDSYTNPQCGLNVDQNAIITSPANLEQFDFLLYRADIAGNLPGLTRVVIPDDLYLRFGDYARGGVAISCPLQSVQSTPNSATLYPDNFYGDFYAPRADSRVTSDLINYYSTMYFSLNANYQNMMFRPIFYEFDEGGTLDSVQWYSLPVYGNGSGGTAVYLIVMCPYIGSSMSGEPPAETTTTDSGAGSVTTVSGGDINVDVNVDLDETNSILEDILEGISSFVSDIVEGVVYIFKPVDDDYIENWLDDMGDVISEAFSDKVDIDILRDMLLDLGSYGATTSIEFPSFSIGDYTFPARAVALRPAGFDSLFNLVETAVNLVCTIWVFNMVLMRIKAVFVGESVVEVEGDVE